MRKTGVVLDFVVILIFVAIGRSVHDHGIKVAGMASTTWPFLVGMLAGALVVGARQRSSTTLKSGLTVCAATVAIGMVLRVVSGQGTAAAFVIVALVFLGAMMLGWRGAWSALQRRQSSRRKA